MIEFRWPQKVNYCTCMQIRFRHEIHDCHSGSNGRNIETIKRAEILPVNLVDRLYLSVVSCGYWQQYTAYLVGFRGHRKLIAICGKCDVTNDGIWKNESEKNCDPYKYLTFHTGYLPHGKLILSICKYILLNI